MTEKQHIKKFKVKQQGKYYHITPTPYHFNNKTTAEHLCNTLNKYEELIQSQNSK